MIDINIRNVSLVVQCSTCDDDIALDSESIQDVSEGKSLTGILADYDWEVRGKHPVCFGCIRDAKANIMPPIETLLQQMGVDE